MLKQYKLRNYHFELIVSIIILNVIGILLIGSAKHSVQKTQIMGMAMGLVAMLVISLMDYSFLLRFTWIYYVGIIGLLIAVKIFGDDAKGATRWIEIAGIRFQPSELAKIVIILFFAYFFMKYQEKINTVPVLLSSFMLLGIPFLLILKQPDMSTSIAVALIFVSLLFIAGLSYKIILTVLGISVPIGIVGFTYVIRIAETATDFHFGRIMAWLYPTDPKWAQTAAQQQNSIMAIGSGQLMGKGYKTNQISSVKNANFISEQQTDFIFAVIGEEFGFIGTSIVVILILLISIECFSVARKAKDVAGTIIASGVGALIGFQSFINIGVVTYLLPNTGLPLPFLSYGLTSLISSFIGIGFVLNVGLQCKEK